MRAYGLIHVVQLLLIPLLAIHWLTDGLTSTAARISRVALLPCLVFWSPRSEA
jgi:hypothetical protein